MIVSGNQMIRPRKSLAILIFLRCDEIFSFKKAPFSHGGNVSEFMKKVNQNVASAFISQ